MNGNYYALKIIPKYNLKRKGILNNLINEPKILKKIKSNGKFIPELFSSFQDYENLYLVTTFYEGSTLDKIINEKLSEEQIKFISACILQAFKHIRKNQIIHRDLTVHNLILDKDNYFNLIDFSFSIDYANRYSKELTCNIFRSLTPPEIFNNLKYDYNSDYYRLGAIIFLLVFKKYPWNVKQTKNIHKFICDNSKKGNYSTELFEFMEGLLQENIQKRFGYKNIDELIYHPWFKGYNWIKLKSRRIISPFNNKRINMNHSFCKEFKKTKKLVGQYILLTKEEYYRKLIKDSDFFK